MGTDGGKTLENFFRIELQLGCSAFVQVIFNFEHVLYSRTLRYWNLFWLVCFYRFFIFTVDLLVERDTQDTWNTCKYLKIKFFFTLTEISLCCVYEKRNGVIRIYKNPTCSIFRLCCPVGFEVLILCIVLDIVSFQETGTHLD